MFILIVLFLFLSSFLFSANFASFSIIEFLVFLIIFFYVQVLGISISLGIFNLLYPQNFLIFSFTLFLFSLSKIKKIKLPKFKILSFSISLLLSLTISLHLCYIFNLLILPPLTTDGLLYHLPFAVHYYKTGSISLPNLYFTDIAMTYYPNGGEIF
ncbi:MAG: hypothetical protein NZ891_08160, partial [bacterium]|nr:hypothetical protein [bacterium]MDW8164693.1 hypothetical protein [Candidatus Omnitrophota bacterium]